MGDRKKVSKITIILYLCAILMTIYTIFIIYKSNAYISDLVSQGFDPSKEIVEVISYYLSTAIPYIFYAVSLFSLGYLINKVDFLIQNQNQNQNIIIESNEYFKRNQENKDDEIDDFFNDVE